MFANRKFVVLLLVGVGAVTAPASVFAATLVPSTPPLLKGVRAEGGWWSGVCPPRPDEPASTKDRHEARSSDVEVRLGELFPPGTAEQTLTLALQRQGFQLTAPCENDAQIHHAAFRQTGGGIAGPFPVYADIAWKADDLDRVVWTKASIAYTGF